MSQARLTCRSRDPPSLAPTSLSLVLYCHLSCTAALVLTECAAVILSCTISIVAFLMSQAFILVCHGFIASWSSRSLEVLARPPHRKQLALHVTVSFIAVLAFELQMVETTVMRAPHSYHLHDES